MARAHIVLPGIHTELNVSEDSLLQADEIQAVYLHHFNKVWERATSRSMARVIEVDRIVTALSGSEPRQQSTNQSWIIGIIGTLLGA
jgi:hypothetical protein